MRLTAWDIIVNAKAAPQSAQHPFVFQLPEHGSLNLALLASRSELRWRLNSEQGMYVQQLHPLSWTPHSRQQGHANHLIPPQSIGKNSPHTSNITLQIGMVIK